MLKAGFSRLDITPPLDAPIAGYYKTRYANGILDPIYLNAVAIGNDEATILIITADLLMTHAATPFNSGNLNVFSLSKVIYVTDNSSGLEHTSSSILLVIALHRHIFSRATLTPYFSQYGIRER